MDKKDRKKMKAAIEASLESMSFIEQVNSVEVNNPQSGQDLIVIIDTKLKELKNEEGDISEEHKQILEEEGFQQLTNPERWMRTDGKLQEFIDFGKQDKPVAYAYKGGTSVEISDELRRVERLLRLDEDQSKIEDVLN